MAVKFCPKCSSVLIPIPKKGGFVLKCRQCNFFKKIQAKPLIETEKIKHKPNVGEGIIRDKNIFATYHHKCKKCGYGKAQILDLGIFYSDEDNLIMLECGKCGYSERVSKKTS